MDFLSFDADFEGVDLDLGVVAPLAVVNAESPGMPRTSHDAGLKIAAGQRSAHVRAKIVDGRVFAVFVEDGDHAVVHRIGLSLTVGDVADTGDSDEIRIGGVVGHVLNGFHVPSFTFQVGIDRPMVA